MSGDDIKRHFGTRKPTVYDTLAHRLGRPPTHAEQVREVSRILFEAREALMIADAEAGRLPHQRGRMQ